MSNVTDAAWTFLFDLYLVIAVVVGLLVLGWLVYALARFRDRGLPEHADAPRAGAVPVERGHVFWIWVMSGAIAVVLFGLILGTAELVNVIEEPPEEPSLQVNVTGFQFGWTFSYPEGFDSFGELRVPVDRLVTFRVTSTDVLHNFAIPAFNIRIDAMPGKHTDLWFKATSTGNATIRCAEFCGVGHAYMAAELQVVPPEEYEAWVAHETAETPEHEREEANVTLGDDTLNPVPDRVVSGEPTRVRVMNAGTEPHAFAVGNWSPYKWEREVRWATPPIEAGESHVLTLRPEGDAALDVWCPLPGHDHGVETLRVEVVGG